MAEKYQFFDGLRFTRDDKTGYYLNSKTHKRMHRYVWEYYNGRIPRGCEIHHKDFDKSNNDISNLELLTISGHRKLHAELLTQQQREQKRENLNKNARPKAIEWHKSEEGRAWHREHYEITKAGLHVTYEYKCLHCGKKFIGDYGSKFCSNRCKSAYRRANDLDLIEKSCVICGKSFMTNKYRPGDTCSASCRARLGHMR